MKMLSLFSFSIFPLPLRLVSYELLNEHYSDPLKVIISSRALYFFKDSPPDPDTLTERVDLSDLQECRASSSRTSE